MEFNLHLLVIQKTNELVESCRTCELLLRLTKRRLSFRSNSFPCSSSNLETSQYVENVEGFRINAFIARSSD